MSLHINFPVQSSFGFSGSEYRLSILYPTSSIVKEQTGEVLSSLTIQEVALATPLTILPLLLDNPDRFSVLYLLACEHSTTWFDPDTEMSSSKEWLRRLKATSLSRSNRLLQKDEQPLIDAYIKFATEGEAGLYGLCKIVFKYYIPPESLGQLLTNAEALLDGIK